MKIEIFRLDTKDVLFSHECENNNIKTTLENASLNGANLDGADLRNAYLRYAKLGDANLNGANLNGADLSYADLRGAYLDCANLRNAYLIDADLRGADLRGADLRGAELSDADLSGADLSDADINIQTQGLSILAPVGKYIAWKKADTYIVKLEIPANAKRSNATTRKIRSDRAKCLAIQNIDGSNSGLKSVTSERGGVYNIGKTIYSINAAGERAFDENRWNECSTGIHHFIDRNDAVNW